jgi:antitoxin (DNA-binding transcriptional repressor) of toxin-antitoxin stability system
MYKKRIILDSSNRISDVIDDLKDGEAIQLLEKGKSVRVVITQEEYFKLMAKSNESSGIKVPFDKIKLENEIKNKIKEMDNGFTNHEKNHQQGISEF